jgi:hypothetical protein
VTDWTHSPATVWRVIDVSNKCKAEAEQCAEHGLYRAACVLAGAALEGAFLSTVMVSERKLKGEDLWPSTSKDVLDWSLAELREVAFRAGWIKAEFRGQRPPLDESDLGNAIDWLKWLRSLQHPGAFVRELDEGMELGEAAWSNAYGVLDQAYDALSVVLDGLVADYEGQT